MTVCVVAHTHWDREWYHPAARFRQRLVALVDVLVQDGTTPATPFLLDGQAVVLEDYLAVRPEAAGRLGELLRSGAIEAGPWYVLADGLIPSAEATVRNLQVGRRVLRRLGATAPAVAYCPDTFGHAQALPTVAAGFGFPLAIVWRGYGGERWPPGDTVLWAADSGARVVLYHLPPDGYETGSALPVGPSEARERWSRLGPLLHNRCTTGVGLLPSGADHHARPENLADAIAALDNAAGADQVVRTSLGGFADRLRAAVTANGSELPVIHGELRDSYGYTWTLGGTLGTRASQKRANALAERALLRDVEPWLVLAWLHGEPRTQEIDPNATVTLAQAPALLDAAWRTLLRAHPHDTLCGCSIDSVARAMDRRLESVRSQAEGLRAAALDMAMRHNPLEARTRSPSATSMLVVRNRTATARGGVAEVVLDEMVADVPVGPPAGAATHAVPTLPAVATTNAVPTIPAGAPTPAVANAEAEAAGHGAEDRNADGHTVLQRPSGFLHVGEPPQALVVQSLSSRLVHRRRESPQHYPDNDLVRAHRALVWVPPVAGWGLLLCPVSFDGSASLNGSLSAQEPNSATSGSVKPFQPTTAFETCHGVQLGNGRLTVFADGRGVRITCDTRTIQNALAFETTTDVGDSYTPATRGAADTLSIVSVKLLAAGPLRAAVRVSFGTSGQRERVRVRAVLSLDAEADAVRIEIVGHNDRRNHRLRLVFRTDVTLADGAAPRVWADAAFGPLARAALIVPERDQAREMVPGTMPMHRWATMVNATVGATLHSDGLAEVEPQPGDGSFALTLLRAIGELSRANLPERPGHAGWPAAVPMAQSHGRFRAGVGLQLHGAWCQHTRDVIERASDALLLPLAGDTLRDLHERRAATLSIAGPRLQGVALRCSAVTVADDGDGIVLRCVNDSFTAQTGSWTLPYDARWECAESRLDETLIEPWRPCQTIISFTAPPRGVVTLRVRRLTEPAHRQ